MTNTNDNWDKLFQQLPLDVTPSEDHHRELRTRVLNQFDKQSPTPAITSRLKHTGRILMKYKAPHWTAAVVLIACASWMFQSSSPACAVEDVVAHIMKARTAQWEMIVKSEGFADQTVKFYLVPGQMRQEFTTGMVMVTDWNQGQSVGLFEDEKLAFKRSDAKHPGRGMEYNQFEKMRDRLREAMEDPDKNVEELGEKQFEGRTLVGFRFQSQKQLITIWADPDTAFPIRIEMDFPPSKTKLVMMNYQFNIEIDPSLFSLDVPEGYSVRDENSPISLGDERDLIESLRMYCKSSEGEFPAGLGADATANAMSRYTSYLVKQNYADQVKRSLDELGQESLRLMRGFTFATGLAASGKWDAHYAGAGVRLGTEDRPIFWYKPGKSGMYRVIYADLSVRDAVAAPKIADAVKLAP